MICSWKLVGLLVEPSSGTKWMVEARGKSQTAYFPQALIAVIADNGRAGCLAAPAVRRHNAAHNNRLPLLSSAPRAPNHPRYSKLSFLARPRRHNRTLQMFSVFVSALAGAAQISMRYKSSKSSAATLTSGTWGFVFVRCAAPPLWLACCAVFVRQNSTLLALVLIHRNMPKNMHISYSFVYSWLRIFRDFIFLVFFA